MNGTTVNDATALPREARVPGARAVLRVFTHPACAGCGEAVRRAARFAEEHPEVELRTVRLEEAEGLAEAHAERILNIPTTILERDGRLLGRWVGAPEAAMLEAALAAAAEASR